MLSSMHSLNKSTEYYFQALEKLRSGLLDITEILDNEDLLSDAKLPVSKLSGVFMEIDQIKKLFDFIKVVPSSDSDPKRAYKYPFNACELLCSENTVLVKMIFEEPFQTNESENGNLESIDDDELEISLDLDFKEGENFISVVPTKIQSYEPDIGNDQDIEETNSKKALRQESFIGSICFPIHKVIDNNGLLEYFFNFLVENEGEYNDVLAGYFAKVFNHFMTIRQSKLINFLFNKKQNILKHLYFNIRTKAIGECVFHVLNINSNEIPNLRSLKESILVSIIQMAFVYNDTDLGYFSEFLLQILESAESYFYLIYSKEVFELINQLTLHKINSASLVSLLKVLIEINYKILRDFGKLKVTKSYRLDSRDWQNSLEFNPQNSIPEFNQEPQDSSLLNLESNYHSIYGSFMRTIEGVSKDFLKLRDDEVKKYFNASNRTQERLGLRRYLEFEYFVSAIDILVNTIAIGKFDIAQELKDENSKCWYTDWEFISSGIVSILNINMIKEYIT